MSVVHLQVNSYYDVATKRSNIAMLLEKYGPNRVKFFEGDLCDAPFIARVFEEEGVEWVVHMAARAGVRPSIEDPFVYVHSNVEATTRLLELSRLHGVKSFVFASSSSVYGGSQKEVRVVKIVSVAVRLPCWMRRKDSVSAKV